MLLDAIRAELGRLQVHAVNLGVETNDDGRVSLQGSLLKYWDLPTFLDGQWLLVELQRLPDAAGPEAVMHGLVAAHGENEKSIQSRISRTQLRLFDPQSRISAAEIAIARKDS